jgi:hypothetical protein
MSFLIRLLKEVLEKRQKLEGLPGYRTKYDRELVPIFAEVSA